MRFILLVMLISALMTSASKAQNWQSLVSVDSRIGYSSNTYLNPFLSEWNSAVESSYNLTSVILQTSWYKVKNAVSLTGGVMYEPLFVPKQNWTGGLGILNYNYYFSNTFSAGLEAGSSYFTSSYSRTLVWIQPKLTYFISPFSLLRLKVGSNFRNYQNYLNSQNTNNRFDLYSLEFETWPSYQWQLKAGLYGSLDSLPAIQDGFNLNGSAGYYFRNGASVSFNINWEQYTNEIARQVNGGPPMGPPPNQQTVTVSNTDRIAKFNIDATYPINEHFSVLGTAGVMNFKSESSGNEGTDFEFSGGIRFSFEPRFRSDKNTVVTPAWQKKGGQQQIKIKYNGKGRLYLVGDFNNWKRTGIPLREQDNDVYVTQLKLSPGAYEYKVLRIQGNTEEWLPFSDDTYTVNDAYGSQNAMLLVE